MEILLKPRKLLRDIWIAGIVLGIAIVIVEVNLMLDVPFALRYLIYTTVSFIVVILNVYNNRTAISRISLENFQIALQFLGEKLFHVKPFKTTVKDSIYEIAKDVIVISDNASSFRVERKAMSNDDWTRITSLLQDYKAIQSRV
jgi:hypothetical protein